jgi:hypothetical protein
MQGADGLGGVNETAGVGRGRRLRQKGGRRDMAVRLLRGGGWSRWRSWEGVGGCCAGAAELMGCWRIKVCILTDSGDMWGRGEGGSEHEGGHRGLDV